jgi:hypothetical protein
MRRHSVTLTMKPIPLRYGVVYERRGMTVPDASSGKHWGALVPYRFRAVHKWIANTYGFYWLPCPVCSRPFGGHEIGGSVPLEESSDGSGMFQCICPSCTAQMYGGRP